MPEKLMKEVVCPQCNSTKFVWKIAEEVKHNKIRVEWLCSKCGVTIETELID